MRLVVAGLAEPVGAHDAARLRRLQGPGDNVVWLAQMVAAMPSIIGGTTEIMKAIIARDLTGLWAWTSADPVRQFLWVVR
jgi:hypothetical protein